MEMKLKKLNIERQFDLALLFKMHKVQAFSCTRTEAEAAGITNVVCSFSDCTNNYVIIIEDDCATLSNESIRVILCRELAHVLIPSLAAEQADEFAARFTNQATVKKAHDEMEKVCERIRYARAGIYTPAEIF